MDSFIYLHAKLTAQWSSTLLSTREEKHVRDKQEKTKQGNLYEWILRTDSLTQIKVIIKDKEKKMYKFIKNSFNNLMNKLMSYHTIRLRETSICGLSPRANYIDRPIVSEVSANVCGQRVLRCQRDWSLRPYSRLSKPEPLPFLPSSPSIVLTRLSVPWSRPTTSQKIW
jgi:hypothetical protein